MEIDAACFNECFVVVFDKLEFVGVVYGKEIIRNEFGRTVAVVSYYSNKTSRLLEKMVFGRRNFIEKEPSAGRKNKPYRKYGNPYYMGKANYRYSCRNPKGKQSV